MRLALVLATLGLALSAYLAPAYHAARRPDDPSLAGVVLDARTRLEQGKEANSLGLLMTAYEELSEKDPSDLEMRRGRVRTALLLAGAAGAQPEVGVLARDNIAAFLQLRRQADPDGSFVREATRGWVDARVQHEWWKARSGIAIYLAAIGDERGPPLLLAFPKQARFFEEFFPYVNRFHPAFRAVEPILRHYLSGDDLSARAQSGVALLLYRTLYGVGGDLLEEKREVIRSAFLEAKGLLAPTDLEPREFNRGNACIVGLALLQGGGSSGVLEGMRPIDYPAYIESLRLARLLAGLDPLSRYDVASREWARLDPGFQSDVLRAAAYRLALHVRQAKGDLPREEGVDLDAAIAVERKLTETALYSGDDTVRIYCLRALAALYPKEMDGVLRKLVDGRGVASIYAALLLDDIDRTPILFPAISSTDPGTSALAATGLLAEGDLLPIERGRVP